MQLLEPIELLEPAEAARTAEWATHDVRVVVSGLERWAHVSRRFAVWIDALPPSGMAVFTRLVAVPGDVLGETLRSWWERASDGGMVRVDRVLGQPERRTQQWSITGEMHVHTCGRWLPIDVELWSHLDQWTRLTLQPKFRPHTTRMYFRRGNRSVDAFVSGVVSCVPS